MSDPSVLFEDLSEDPPEDEADADCDDVPADLIQLSVDLEPTGMTPEEFKVLFGGKVKKPKPVKPKDEKK